MRRLHRSIAEPVWKLRGALFSGKRPDGATKENIPGGSSTEEQRSQTAFSPKTLRAAGLLPVAGVGSFLTARCGDARNSPPWPQPKSLAAAPLVVSKQALSKESAGYTTLRRPIPAPLEKGGWDTASRAATNRDARDWRKRRRRFSLSPRERAGVRGKQRSKHQRAWRLTPVLLRTRREICFRQHRLLARGAGRVELVNSVRPFWVAASRSPSPWPSPSGRGDTASRAATSRDALDWRKRGGRFSLSPRAGVRGKQLSK